MALNLAEWGNALHSGEKSYGIVRRRVLWFIVSGFLVALSLGSLIGNGIHAGIDFVGGTVVTVTDVSSADPSIAEGAVHDVVPGSVPFIQPLTQHIPGSPDVVSMRVELREVTDTVATELKNALADAYTVDGAIPAVTSEYIGASWGGDVTSKAIKSLVIFLILVSILMTAYFRDWRMAAAGLVALLHDLIFTVGVYTALGFEVTPASVIGFLTILGYSLYDTVVVFDKVRENTASVLAQHRYTYAELANLALNQTLVRSINTSIVALLPVSAILFVGAILMGAGTLKDLSLALFVGMAVGTYSSIFVATPLEVTLVEREPNIRAHTAAVLKARETGGAVVAADGSVRVGPLVKGEHKGIAAQPKRRGRS